MTKLYVDFNIEFTKFDGIHEQCNTMNKPTLESGFNDIERDRQEYVVIKLSS